MRDGKQISQTKCQIKVRFVFVHRVSYFEFMVFSCCFSSSSFVWRSRGERTRSYVMLNGQKSMSWRHTYTDRYCYSCSVALPCDRSCVCVGLTAHLAGLVEISEIFQQTLGPGSTGFVEELVQGLQGFGEITRKVTSLQSRRNVRGADALWKTKSLRAQLLNE